MDRRASHVAFGAALIALTTLLFPSQAFAQDEDIEPRTVGSASTTQVGVSGFLDTFRSSEDTFPLQLTVQADLRRFVSSHIAVRGGLIGSSSFGEAAGDVTGPGAPALNLQIGADYYFTPASIASLYAGSEYRTPLTGRADKEAGTVLGIAGVQATLSSRASVFVQGGYGVRLTRGAEDEAQKRFTGEVGLRFKF